MIGFSIITIVYNGVADIQKTINSVIGQSYKNIEYILIDGWSSDGTREKIYYSISSCAKITQKIVKEKYLFLEAVHKIFPTITFKFLSEKDKGIYDAMNKGIYLATNTWVNFMNCGDRFYNSYVLQTIADQDIKKSDVIYGDTEVVDQNGRTKLCIASKKTHKFHHNFVHQSSFVSNKLLKNYPYNTAFKIAGDTDLFTRLYNAGYIFQKLDIVVSVFFQNGVSSTLSWTMFCEECKIGFKYNKLFPLYLTIKWICWTIPKKQIKKFLFS